MKREPQHVLNFYKNELGCEGTIGAENMLILNGGYQQKHFIKIIKNYIGTYVKCNICGGYNTIIEKNIKDRLDYLKCDPVIGCGASRTVPPLATAFRAVRRGERRKAR